MEIETTPGSQAPAQTPATAAPQAGTPPAAQPQGTATPTPTPELPKAEVPPKVESAPAPKIEEKPKTEPEVAADIVIKPPEGIKGDEVVLKGYSEIAKAAGLKQEQAQKVADFYFDLAKKQEEAGVQALAAYEKKNIESLKADPTFGGAQYDANVEIAKQAFVRFGEPALFEELKQMGLGSHPGLLRMALKIGNAIREDGASARNTPPPPVASRQAELEARYPSMQKK